MKLLCHTTSSQIPNNTFACQHFNLLKQEGRDFNKCLHIANKCLMICIRGFKDSTTAHLMMKRAKKLKYNAERKKKLGKLGLCFFKFSSKTSAVK